MCLTCSKAKQTETLAFGAEKGLLQGLARKACDLCSKHSNSLMVFKGECLFYLFKEDFSKGEVVVRAAGRVVFQGPCAQPEVIILPPGWGP